MKTSRNLLAALAAVSVLTVSAFASDISGNWSWPSSSKTGGPTVVTAVLLLKDGKLTGIITSRQGPAEISNASFKDNVVAFTATRPAGATALVIKYSGHLEGDKITGTIERGATENSSASKRDWVATRAP